ncbi:MAG: GNAT family N-acetyltransferase [Dysgonamonadaceae bacterium]|jgi:ribosomal protein S18 acetylase RimI-like enzyme|nr:GNAT family N-acetyltransferase [Dysgonamonadaceae bacterium]
MIAENITEMITMDKNTVYKKPETDEEIVGAKQLIVAYIQWLSQDLSFQNIDDELSTFPEKYSEPEGTFLIAKENNEIVGCVGIKKLENGICEMKRLFVNDRYRGNGTAKKLVEMIIEEAKLKHYERMRLDTLDTMKEALNIYRKNGFYEIESYYNNPADGVIYLEKILQEMSSI